MGNIEWMPIETAPKDGSSVLLWCPDSIGGERPRHLDDHVAIAAWTPDGWQGPDVAFEAGWESTGSFVIHINYSPTYWAEITPP